MIEVSEMTVRFITALQAAETLCAYHRQHIDQTLGARRQEIADAMHTVRGGTTASYM
jgi:hypothetical protein